MKEQAGQTQETTDSYTGIKELIWLESANLRQYKNLCAHHSQIWASAPDPNPGMANYTLTSLTQAPQGHLHTHRLKAQLPFSPLPSPHFPSPVTGTSTLPLSQGPAPRLLSFAPMFSPLPVP